MRFVGESGTAVTGEVGREDIEPFSDMERGGGVQLSRRHARFVGRPSEGLVIDTRTVTR